MRLARIEASNGIDLLFQDNVAHSCAMGGMSIFSMYAKSIVPLETTCAYRTANLSERRERA